jgi:hypothetical protein
VGSFITGTEVETIQDEGWEPWEKVTIREYSQGAKDIMDKETVRMAGQPGKIPEIVQEAARVPVMVAGLESWTLRNLSDQEVRRIYEKHAKELGKEVTTLTNDDKCQAIENEGEKAPIVPLTREWISKLKPRYAAFITAEIRTLNQEMTDTEVRNFLREAGSGAEDGGQLTL